MINDSQRKKRLRLSILLTTGIYFLIQCLTFSAFAIPGQFFDVFWKQFLGVSFGFHLFLISLMFYFIEDFTKEATGEKLSSINLANRITLIRVSTLPTLLFLVIAARSYKIRYPLLILVVFIFITDFLDGYVSRKSNEVTRIGRMMDSTSDYSLLIVLSLVFRYYKLIPTWFLILVLTRLGIQVVLVAILIVIKQKIEPKTTMMGKVAVAAIMITYSAEVLGLIIGGLPTLVRNSIEWIVAGILVASIGDKIWSFIAALNEHNSRRIDHGTH